MYIFLWPLAINHGNFFIYFFVKENFLLSAPIKQWLIFYLKGTTPAPRRRREVRLRRPSAPRPAGRAQTPPWTSSTKQKAQMWEYIFCRLCRQEPIFENCRAYTFVRCKVSYSATFSLYFGEILADLLQLLKSLTQAAVVCWSNSSPLLLY
jgi:hypothetical protein